MHSPTLLPVHCTLVSWRRCCINWFRHVCNSYATCKFYSIIYHSLLLLLFGSAFNNLLVLSRVLLFGRRWSFATECTSLVSFFSVIFFGIVPGTSNGGRASAFCFCLIAPRCFSVLCLLLLGSFRANSTSGSRCLSFVLVCGVVVLVQGTASEVCAKYGLLAIVSTLNAARPLLHSVFFSVSFWRATGSLLRFSLFPFDACAVSPDAVTFYGT